MWPFNKVEIHFAKICFLDCKWDTFLIYKIQFRPRTKEIDCIWINVQLSIQEFLSFADFFNNNETAAHNYCREKQLRNRQNNKKIIYLSLIVEKLLDLHFEDFLNNNVFCGFSLHNNNRYPYSIY